MLQEQREREKKKKNTHRDERWSLADQRRAESTWNTSTFIYICVCTFKFTRTDNKWSLRVRDDSEQMT